MEDVRGRMTSLGAGALQGGLGGVGVGACAFVRAYACVPVFVLVFVCARV